RARSAAKDRDHPMDLFHPPDLNRTVSRRTMVLPIAAAAARVPGRKSRQITIFEQDQPEQQRDRAIQTSVHQNGPDVAGERSEFEGRFANDDLAGDEEFEGGEELVE